MNTNDSSSEIQRTAVAKKPYEKPTFRYEKVFVTSALTCGKISGTSDSCNISPRVS
jgi:hypothetical protein